MRFNNVPKWMRRINVLAPKRLRSFFLVRRIQTSFSSNYEVGSVKNSKTKANIQCVKHNMII